MKEEIEKYFKRQFEKLIDEFEESSELGKGTPQEVSDFREFGFQKFIRRYFPYPYTITKGIIIDSFGSRSGSIDCLILNPNHPNLVDTEGKFSLILADGVDMAIEIKPDLSKKKELTTALDQIKKVKSLSRYKTPLFNVAEGKQEHVKKYSLKIPSFIFSINANATLEDTARNALDYYNNNNISVDDQFDFIVSIKQGIISNYKIPELSRASDKSLGIFVENWENYTLPAFLLKTCSVISSSPRLSAHILEYYLSGISPNAFVPIR